MSEQERHEATDFPVTVLCHGGCGRVIRLFFNGGELDRRECCGFRYTLEHVRIDFVATKL